MSEQRLRPAIVAAAASGLLGCGLILGIDDRTSGATVATENDDAGAPVDAANVIDDLPKPPDSGAEGFCSSQGTAPTFCLDFESGKPEDAWDQMRVEGGAAFSFVQDGTRGTVLSLKMPSSGMNGACLTRGFPGNKGKVTVDVDLRIAKPGGGAEALDLVRIGDPAKVDTNVSVEIHANLVLAVDEDLETGGSKITDLGAKLGASWKHLQLVFSVGTDTELRSSIDGAPLEIVHTNSEPFKSPTLDLQLGDCSAGDGVDWEVLFDNLTLTTQ